MSEQIREQVSAFIDGELPGPESELLLKRLMRDAELREHFGRYALIGESMRGAGRLSQNFLERVNLAVDGGAAVEIVPPMTHVRQARWWRPFAGAAVAAGVAAVAVVGLQQRAVAPTVGRPAMALASNAVPAGLQTPKEAYKYTTPRAAADTVIAMPQARLTNYVFAHSKYSSMLGQNNVLSNLLAEDDEDVGAARRSLRSGNPESP